MREANGADTQSYGERKRRCRFAEMRAEALCVAVCLLAALLMYFWPVAFRGQALLPADLLFDDPVWHAQAPTGYTNPSNALLSDQVNQFLPWRRLALAELRQGRLPLWNPYEMGGTPLLANDQSAVFFPLTLLLGWLPTDLIPGWSAILRLWIAAFGMYALLRWWRASRPAAVLAAASFTLGGSLILLLGHPHMNVAVWLPLLILSTDKVVASSRPWPWTLLAAALIGMQFLGGHAETSFFVLTTWALFAVVCLLARSQPALFATRRSSAPDENTGVAGLEPVPAGGAQPPAGAVQRSCQSSVTGGAFASRIGLLVLAMLLGAALAGVQLLPFLELLPQSNYFLRRSAAAQQHQPLIYLGFWRDLARLPTMILPNLFGNPVRGDWWLGTAFLNYTDVLYLGALPLAFAVAGGWLRRRMWQAAFFAVLALFSLVVIFRLPIVDWIRRLPLLSVTAVSEGLTTVYCFSAAVLAAFGVDAVMDRSYRRNLPKLARMLLGLSALIGLVLLAVGIALRTLQGPILNLGRRYVETVVYGKPPHPYPLEHYLGQLEDTYRQLVGVFDPTRPTLYLPLLFAFAGALTLWAVHRRRLQRGLAGWLLAGLVVVDLWAFGAGFNPVMPPDQVLPSTPALEWLTQHQGYQRSVGVGELLMPNTAVAFRVFDARGYDVSLGVSEGWPGMGRQLTLEQLLDPGNEAYLDLASVRYVLSAAPIADTKLRLAYDGEIKIYERSSALPRAYLAGAYSVISDGPALWNQLRSTDVAAGQRVLLTEQPAPAPGGQTARQGKAEIRAFQPGQIAVATDNSEAGFLVLTDTYYPGWHAEVDGRAAPIHRTNHMFRSVFVPPGRHTVVFRYEPASFRIGAALTLASLGFLACAAGWLGICAQHVRPLAS